MPVPLGTQVYDATAPPVVARGYELTTPDLDQALVGDVGDLLEDVGGREELEDLWTSLTNTKFAQQNVQRALQSSHPVEDWRVGEVLAEGWLMTHQSCSFPWPFGRDLRNPSASPAGADLVGFHHGAAAGVRFAFGEVKTSGEAKYPPLVVTSRTGLAKQIEGLRDLESKKDPLVRYLGFRCQGQPWEPDYRVAATKYFTDSTDLALFGVLVRDVAPDQRDLAARSGSLATACPAKTQIMLFALYLDRGCIPNLPQRTQAARQGP